MKSHIVVVHGYNTAVHGQTTRPTDNSAQDNSARVFNLICISTIPNYRACKWVMIHGGIPRDWSWLQTGHKNNIITTDDSYT